MAILKKHKWFISVAIGGILCLVLIQGLTVRRAQAVSESSYEELETFANVLTIVQKNYVDPVSTKQLINGAITGMLASLDPHSAYLTPELYKDLQIETRGSFGGLGIEITIKNGMLTVVSPIEDTPAYKAGIKSNDQIIKIDSNFTKDMTLTDAVKAMRGPKGSKITQPCRSSRRGTTERSRDWCSICATIPAVCSTRRCTWRMTFWTAG
jgi:carboxyl-terminal processing protease